MSNVLSDEKKQQAIALGRLGWSLRRIQKETGIHRETVSAYLKAADIPMRLPRGQYIRPKPASRDDEVITDLAAKPASQSAEVITGFGAGLASVPATKPDSSPGFSPTVSASEPHREAIELGLARGRNAMAIWQDLVDSSGFSAGYQSVRRYISKLRGSQSPEACAVIETSPGEECQVDYGDGPMVRDPESGDIGARGCSC